MSLILLGVSPLGGYNYITPRRSGSSATAGLSCIIAHTHGEERVLTSFPPSSSLLFGKQRRLFIYSSRILYIINIYYLLFVWVFEAIWKVLNYYYIYQI